MKFHENFLIFPSIKEIPEKSRFSMFFQKVDILLIYLLVELSSFHPRHPAYCSKQTSIEIFTNSKLLCNNFIIKIYNNNNYERLM